MSYFIIFNNEKQIKKITKQLKKLLKDKTAEQTGQVKEFDGKILTHYRTSIIQNGQKIFSSGFIINL